MRYVPNVAKQEYSEISVTRSMNTERPRLLLENFKWP